MNAPDAVCLECWRDFTRDFLHLDCTGEHIVPKAEADELRSWLTGRYEFIVRTGQRIGPAYIIKTFTVGRSKRA